jgi:hypothetical protein
MTLRAKCGVGPTRKRNCFSVMGTSSTSVIATAVALRGSLSIKAISPKISSAVSSATILLPIEMRTFGRGCRSAGRRDPVNAMAHRPSRLK